MQSLRLRMYPAADMAVGPVAQHTKIVPFVFPELVDFFDVLAYHLRIAGVAQG